MGLRVERDFESFVEALDNFYEKQVVLAAKIEEICERLHYIEERLEHQQHVSTEELINTQRINDEIRRMNTEMMERMVNPMYHIRLENPPEVTSAARARIEAESEAERTRAIRTSMNNLFRGTMDAPGIEIRTARNRDENHGSFDIIYDPESGLPIRRPRDVDPPPEEHNEENFEL